MEGCTFSFGFKRSVRASADACESAECGSQAGPVQAPAIVAEDAKTGQHLPDQFFSATYGAPPDTLLVLVRLGAQLRGHPVSR